jgi:myo-inositol-1(or 4)-monophosphatase
MDKELSHITLLAIEAALGAGEILRKGFGGQFTVSSKSGIHNLVTEYDHLSEEFIIEFLRKEFPDSLFLAEESGGKNEGSDTLQWIIDPLDGTVNFAHGLPFFAISIAARQGDEILCGVVYQPITHELFVAQKGVGAFLNGTRVKVSETRELKRAFLATGFPYNLAENPGDCIGHFTDILRQGIPIRRMGVAALDLCYVASGRFDGFFEISLGPWDCAAGILLIEEAGGKVSGWEEEPFDIFAYKPILVTNTHIHEEIAKVLQQR